MNLIPWRGKRHEEGQDVPAGQSPLAQFRGEVDRLFDRFFDTSGMLSEGLGALGRWAPSLDVTETNTEISVRAELPGIDSRDLEITVSGPILTLSGEKKESSETQNENVWHSERRFGSFSRSIQLPAPVETDTVAAEYKNGVLLITLKKQQSAVPKRIPVKSG